jgi:hypothetical protein
MFIKCSDALLTHWLPTVKSRLRLRMAKIDHTGSGSQTRAYKHRWGRHMHAGWNQRAALPKESKIHEDAESQRRDIRTT